MSDPHMIPLDALKRPIAFHPIFADIAGSVTAGLFLSQAWHWTQTLSDSRHGWFYKVQSEWSHETRMSRREIEGARKTLRNLGVIEEHLRGTPARLWYRINQEILANLIAQNVQTSMHETYKLDATKAPNNTENTSENTTETTGDIYTEPPKPTDSPTPKPRRKPSTSIPDDFLLDDAMIEYAMSKAVTEPEAVSEFEKFRNYAVANDRKHVDWRAAWRVWISNAITYGNVGPNAKSRPSGAARAPYKKDIGLSNDELEAIARGEMVI